MWVRRRQGESGSRRLGGVIRQFGFRLASSGSAHGGGLAEAGAGGVRAARRAQELPAHLELVGHVVVELLGGPRRRRHSMAASAVAASGIRISAGRRVASAAGAVGVDALVGGGLGEVDGVGGGGGDATAADDGELAHYDAGEGARGGTPGGSWGTRG